VERANFRWGISASKLVFIASLPRGSGNLDIQRYEGNQGESKRNPRGRAGRYRYPADKSEGGGW